MCSVTSGDISRAVRELGIGGGDLVLVHSSYKSLGSVEGGAAAVIRGFEDVLGKEGTLVFPTLVQVDFDNAYRTWYMDKPSDVGYLSEYFRKQMYVYRSNQATHSVAARGRLAYELTCEHGEKKPLLHSSGPTAFAYDSPWYKMYERNAKMVFLGCSTRCCTMKHMVEGFYAKKLLEEIPEEATRNALRDRLQQWPDDKRGVWPQFHNEEMEPEYEARGFVTRSTCGNAELTCLPAKPCMDTAFVLLCQNPDRWLFGNAIGWVHDCLNAAK